MSNSHLFVLFVVFSAFQFLLSNSLPVQGSNSPSNGVEDVHNNGQNQKAPVIIRQEDEEDDGDDGPADEDTRQKVVSGVGNILTGALSLNPIQVLKGAFGFADREIQDNILNVILGHTPPAQRAKTTEATVTDPPETEATTRVQEITRAEVTSTTVQATAAPITAAKTSRKPTKKTTRPQQQPGAEDDEDYE